MASVREQLNGQREFIHSLVQQNRPLAQIANALETRGVKTSVPTLSRFINEAFPNARQLTPPPVAPAPSPAPPPPGIDVNVLMGDVLAELEGTRVEIREHMAKLAGKAAVIDAEVQEMGKAVEELVDIGTRPPDSAAPTIQWGATRETVKRIWQSALFITATAWLAVIMLVSWQMPEVASAFLTRLGVKPEKVVQTLPVPLPGPERVTVQKVEVPVPGPERVRVERVEVKVPGPERVTVQKIEVAVPGPERVRIERVEVPGQCSVKPLYTVPDSKETEKLDAACDALASARSSGIAPARRTAAIPAMPPTPSPPPQAKAAEPEKPVAATTIPKAEPAKPDPKVTIEDVKKEIEIWVSLEGGDLRKLLFNRDMLISLCKAMLIADAAMQQKTSANNNMFTNYERKLWREELAVCQQANQEEQAVEKYDTDLFKSYPYRPKSLNPNLPSDFSPTTNNIVVAVGFDVACKHVRYSGTQDPSVWPCQLAEHWRKHRQLIPSPIVID